MDRIDKKLPARGRSPRAAVAIMVAALSIAAAYGLSIKLRLLAATTSHEQPTPEDWFQSQMATSPELIALGRARFLDSCAHCHAADATGDEGPDLHGLEVSDRYIARTITQGIKGEMPSFRKKLKGDDILRLTAYLRSLN